MLVILISLLGCTPDCEQTCKKLLRCEVDAPLMNQDECESACNAQENRYDDDDLVDEGTAFDALKSCIVAETCEDLDAGVCYDETVYSW